MSNKNNNAQEFTKEYVLLTETDKNTFSKIISKLLNDTFILKEHDKDTMDFYFIRENESLFANYFLIIDYELIFDKFNGIMYIKTLENRNRIRLTKFDTAIILILRRLYYIKKKDISQFDNILVTLEDIMNEIGTSQLFNEPKKVTHYKDTLAKLKKHKIINYQGDQIDENLAIQILSSILVIVPQNSLEAIIARIKGLSKEIGTGESTDEDINED